MMEKPKCQGLKVSEGKDTIGLGVIHNFQYLLLSLNLRETGTTQASAETSIRP